MPRRSGAEKKVAVIRSVFRGRRGPPGPPPRTPFFSFILGQTPKFCLAFGHSPPRQNSGYGLVISKQCINLKGKPQAKSYCVNVPPWLKQFQHEMSVILNKVSVKVFFFFFFRREKKKSPHVTNRIVKNGQIWGPV